MSRLLRRLFCGRSKRFKAASNALELSDLSDWDLLCLMDVQRLEDLLRLGCTNHRFSQLAKRRQPGRRRLLINIGPKSYTCNEQNVIAVPALTITLVDRILSKLPSIASLWVYNDNSDSENLEPIIYLLGRLSAQLQDLHLTFTKAFQQPTSHQPLFAAINRIGKLTNLYLDYRGDSEPFTDDEPAVLHLPIIAQLALFRFCHLMNTEAVLLELIKRATAATPTQISIGGYFNRQALDLLLDIPPGLASRFIELPLISNFINSAHLMNISEKFSNVTQMGLCLNHFTMRQISFNLVKLSRLYKLHLRIDFPNRTLYRQPEVALAHFGELPEPDVIDSANLVPLPAVTELMLSLDIIKHDDLALLHLSTIFPNVTTLEVWIEQCDQCGYNREKINIQAKKRCLAKLIKYWRALPQLQQLKDKRRVMPDHIWKPLPLLGVSRFQLRHTVNEKLVDPVNKITSWITNKFTGA